MTIESVASQETPSTMTGHQRIANALQGHTPDSPPVMLHNFMMAAAEAGVIMRKYRSDPAAIARCFIESVERYGYDGVVVDVDTATLAGAAGVPVLLPDDEPAIVHGSRIRSLAEVPDLEPVDISHDPRVQIWLDAVRRLKAHFGDEVYIRGNCDQAPFSLACSLRGMSDWLPEILDEDNRELVLRLVEYAAGITLQFIRLMAEAGAHMVSNGDSLAGPSVISPRLYRMFALPYEKRIVEEAHRLGLPYMLHICGKTELILADMISTGADALELDYKTDVRRAHDIIAGRLTFVGNLDPSGVLALGTPQDVERKTAGLLQIFADSPRLILNAGCAIPAGTPPDNIRAMIRVAREWSKEKHNAYALH